MIFGDNFDSKTGRPTIWLLVKVLIIVSLVIVWLVFKPFTFKETQLQQVDHFVGTTWTRTDNDLNILMSFTSDEEVIFSFLGTDGTIQQANDLVGSYTLLDNELTLYFEGNPEGQSFMYTEQGFTSKQDQTIIFTQK